MIDSHFLSFQAGRCYNELECIGKGGAIKGYCSPRALGACCVFTASRCNRKVTQVDISVYHPGHYNFIFNGQLHYNLSAVTHFNVTCSNLCVCHIFISHVSSRNQLILGSDLLHNGHLDVILQAVTYFTNPSFPETDSSPFACLLRIAPPTSVCYVQLDYEVCQF